jgi:DnaK suppressor protein
MRDSDVNEYKVLLIAKRGQLVSKSRRREDICIVQSNGQIEAVQLAGQREFAGRTLERETKTLMQIGAALKRIDDGEFGKCPECDEPILSKRLAALLGAGSCLHCRELRDSQGATDTVEPKMAA